MKGSTSNPAGWRRRLNRNWFSHFFNGGCFWWTQGLLIELFWIIFEVLFFSFFSPQTTWETWCSRETCYCFVASNKVGELFFLNCFFNMFYVKKTRETSVQCSSQKTWEIWCFLWMFSLRLKADGFFSIFQCLKQTFEASTAGGPNKVPWPATWRSATPRAKGETGRTISRRLVNYLLGLQVVCKIRWCNQSTKLEGIKNANFPQLTTFKGWYPSIYSYLQSTMGH